MPPFRCDSRRGLDCVKAVLAIRKLPLCEVAH